MKHAFSRSRTRTCACSRARNRRGMTLLEVLIAGALSAAIMGTIAGVYVHGIRGFYRDQAQSYTQFRTRVSLDNIAKEVRSAKAFIPSYGGYTANDGSGTAGACIILQVPAQDGADNMSLFHYGSGSATPNALVTDTVIYRHNKTDKTLRCTIEPARNVVASDGQTRSSYRSEMSDAVVAANVDSLRFVFRNRDGMPIATGSETRTAAVDIITNIKQERGGGAEKAEAIAISGVRLRNMRSGSIPGIVKSGGAPVANAIIRAIYTSADGAYEPGTIVGKAGTDAEGEFEIFGLETGTYTVKAYSFSDGLLRATVTDIYVPEEEASSPVSINMS